MTDSLLAIRPSFELAAWFVTWAAVALLAVVAASLHARLRRLESGRSEREVSRPFSQLIGRSFPASGASPVPRVVLFVASACTACSRILDEVSEAELQEPLGLAWIDGMPATAAPQGFVLLSEGTRLSADLGVRVTPFALVLDGERKITQAAPVGSLGALRELSGLQTGPSPSRSYPRLIKEV